jgi:hypothetical protein
VAGYQTAVAGYQTAVAGYQTAVAGYQTAVAWQDTKLKWQDTKLQWQDTKLQWQPGRSPNCARIFAMLMKVRAPQSAAVAGHQTAHIAPLPCSLAQQPCRIITVLITGRRPAGLQAFLRP